MILISYSSTIDQINMSEACKHQSRERWKILYGKRVLVLYYLYITTFVHADGRSVVNRTGSNNLVYDLKGSSTNPTVDKPATAVEPLSTEPSVTSFHRVWTSTSRGSLGELSPDMVGKLRNDMPFLSAYALRPRLVGGPQVAAEELSVAMSKQRSAAITGQDIQYETAPNQLKSSATNAVGSRQATSDSLIPRLSDFSEFKVETSSTSKSEHHHRRKTSLKRNLNTSKGKRNEARKSRSSSKGSKKFRGKERNRSSANKRHSESLHRSRRLKDSRHRSSPQSINIVRHGRYVEERMIQPNNKGNSEVEMRVAGRDTTTMTVDGGKSGANDISGTKGGSSTKKRPFYDKVKPPVGQPAGNMDENNINRSVKNNKNAEDKGDTTGGSPGDADYDPPLDDETDVEPKRVGDPDVEEEGDTVLVEPKSDGVDDDPSIESAEEGDGEIEVEQAQTAGANSGAGSRKGREQPRVEGENDGEGVDEERGSTDAMKATDLAGGGGLAGTIGSTDPSSDRVNNGRSLGDDRGHVDASPGVEFADIGKSGGNTIPSTNDSDDGQMMDADGPRNPSQDKEEGSDDRRGVGGSDDGSRRSTSSRPEEKRGNRSRGDDEDPDYREESDERRGARPGGDKHKSGGEGDECDGKDHGDGHHEDHHHHGIEWLRGAVPGEPGVDYPILSKVNTIEFSCRDQKYPGYYADVDSRCQVSSQRLVKRNQYLDAIVANKT